MPTQLVNTSVENPETHGMLVRLLTVAELLLNPISEDDINPAVDDKAAENDQDLPQKSYSPQADV